MQRPDLDALLSPERIELIATQLARMTTRPLFLEQTAAVRKVAGADKMDAARAAVERIRRQGTPFPAGFRITTRQFEQPREDQRPVAEIRDGVLTVVYAGGTITVIGKDEPDDPRPQVGSPAHLQVVITQGVTDIGAYVAAPPFKDLLRELYELPSERRPAFVEEVVLDVDARRQRGLEDPSPGLVIQRSTFADGRPTLFCVSKVLPLAYPWHKVTITFDDERDPAATDGADLAMPIGRATVRG
jgi:hypothetical protein